MRVWTILVAAGSGERFGGPKQFSRLGPDRVIDAAFATAADATERVVCVLPAGAEDQAPEGAIVVPGGATRSQSVRNGLAVIPEDVDVVVVHDAARPMASKELFLRVIEEVEAGYDAVVPGVEVVDTIKRTEPAGFVSFVTETLDREELVSVQTPQAFRASVLRNAHESMNDATDDAHLVEQQNVKVLVVAGETANIKITNEDDLHAAELLVQSRGER